MSEPEPAPCRYCGWPTAAEPGKFPICQTCLDDDSLGLVKGLWVALLCLVGFVAVSAWLLDQLTP